MASNHQLAKDYIVSFLQGICGFSSPNKNGLECGRKNVNKRLIMSKQTQVLPWYLCDYMFHPPKVDLIKRLLILLQHGQIDISQALLAQNHT